MTNTFNFSARDRLNSIGAAPLKEIVGKTVTATALAIQEVMNNDGELRIAGVIKTDTNEYYTTVSPTAIRGIDAIIDYCTDENLDKVNLRVVSRLSKSNREFYLVEIAD